MKILVAPDSFKGSLSSVQVAEIIGSAIQAIDSTIEIKKIPIADGGEGTIEAIMSCVDLTIREINVLNPIGQLIPAKYAILEEACKIAFIEMAQASGLGLIDCSDRNPLITTSYGTGQLIKDALEQGCKKIVVGIGGSATNDGGAGALMALGAGLKNQQGELLPLGGGALAELATIDLTHLDERLQKTELVVACDVTSPLTGTRGASYVYGPQKGATSEMVYKLDRALENFAIVSKQCLGRDFSDYPGAGAAGGMGFGLMAFCGAKYVGGIDMILDMCKFDEHLEQADLVITGEGKIDGQSLEGKVLYGIGRRAKKYSVPVIAIGGAITDDSENLIECGITAMFSTENAPMSLEYAIENTELLLVQSVKNIMRVFLM